LIFPSEFAICSCFQNIEETEIQISALFRYLHKENQYEMTTSKKKGVLSTGEIGNYYLLNLHEGVVKGFSGSGAISSIDI